MVAASILDLFEPEMAPLDGVFPIRRNPFRRNPIRRIWEKYTVRVVAVLLWKKIVLRIILQLHF